MILGPDGSEIRKDEGEKLSPLQACMQEFIEAVHSQDAGAAMQAFQGACAHLEKPSGPTEGG